MIEFVFQVLKALFSPSFRNFLKTAQSSLFLIVCGGTALNPGSQEVLHHYIESYACFFYSILSKLRPE
jgi:hypothetical protein